MKLHESVAKFNDAANMNNLIDLFAEMQVISSDNIKSFNSQVDKDKTWRFRFLPIKLEDDGVVYLDEKGELAFCDSTSPILLRSLLGKLKKGQDITLHASKLRTTLLMAGAGLLKSYDVYTVLPMNDLPEGEIKRLIKEPVTWMKERRLLHDKIIKDILNDVRYLSEQIQRSETMESGLYCMRGSVAAGKTTFARGFLKRHFLDNRAVSGIINTDVIKRRLVKEAMLECGIEVPAYLFHDEASVISDSILLRARKEGLIYFIDKRMQYEEDLEELLKDANERNLNITIFDLKTDFITSALRVLSRSGRYPSDPTPNFDGLFKSYKTIEENAANFIEKALVSSRVKNYYSVRMIDLNNPSVTSLKEGFATIESNLGALLSLKNIEKESFESILLASGKTLSQALDEHSKIGYKSIIEEANDYLVSFLENVKNTSRTYNGNLDSSASPDKKDKLNTCLSPEQVSCLADKNLRSAFRFVYDNKDLMIHNTANLKQFINEVAWRLNQDFIQDKIFLFRVGDNSRKYHYVDTASVANFYDTFVQELFFRIKDINIDPIETAAWIEWNVDFSGHIFSDGCGRIAKLISSWLLMRKNLCLPDYAKGVSGFATIRESYRKQFAIREKVSYEVPTYDTNYEKFLKYYKGLFQELRNYEQILAAGGLIYNDAGQFLIIRSVKGKDEGRWVVPGGKLEKGEGPEEAFKREVMEETGLYLKDINLLGVREYTANSGNHYKFYDYSAVLRTKQDVKIDGESSAYKWISEGDIKQYRFGDSIRNFLNKYFTEDMSSYYEEVEQIDVGNLDVPRPDEHTMSHSLKDYVNTKLPMDGLRPYLSQIKYVEVHGIYPDLALISRLKLGFRILEVIHESKPKLDNSNSLRPIFLLAEKEGERMLVCCTTPGRDLLLHYASMLRFTLETVMSLSVYAYPVAEETIDKWTGLDQSMVSKDDIVILGYSTYFKEMLIHEKDFTFLTVCQNKFYTSTRLLSSAGSVVNCLEANYGHWGNISDYLARRICQLGASEILHIGKVGTFTSPSEVYKRIYIPNDFFVGRRSEVIHSQARIQNCMSYIKEYLSLGHVSVSTTMEETFGQRDIFNRRSIETIDIESSKIAQAIATYNLVVEKGVKFGAIHFASDYLRRASELKEDFEFDLSTKRIAKLYRKKDRMLIEIFEVIKHHLLSERTQF